MSPLPTASVTRDCLLYCEGNGYFRGLGWCRQREDASRFSRDEALGWIRIFRRVERLTGRAAHEFRIVPCQDEGMIT